MTDKTNTPSPTHGIRLTDEEVTNVLRRLAIRPGDHDFKLGQCIALAIESALLSKQRAPVADERAAFEAWALTEFTHPFLLPDPLIEDADGSGNYVNQNVQMAWAGYQQACTDRASAPIADSTLPLEQALYELVDKIAPGLDTGDILQDARLASNALDTTLASAPVAGEAVRKAPTEAQYKEAAAIARGFGARQIADVLDPPQASEAVRDMQDADEIDRLKGVLLGIRHRIGQHELFTAIKEIDAALSAQPGAQKDEK